MGRIAVMLTVLLAGLAALAACGDEGLPSGDAYIHWETDLAQATAKAAETGRPLMVVFR